MDLTGPKNHDLAGPKNATITQHFPETNINNTQNFSAHISAAFVFLLHQLFIAPRFFISFHLCLLLLFYLHFVAPRFFISNENAEMFSS